MGRLTEMTSKDDAARTRRLVREAVVSIVNPRLAQYQNAGLLSATILVVNIGVVCIFAVIMDSLLQGVLDSDQSLVVTSRTVQGGHYVQAAFLTDTFA